MSTYGIWNGIDLQDLSDDPEIIFQNFLQSNWSNTISGINVDTVGFGYEPDLQSTKGLLVKIEESFTDINELNLGGSYDQYDFVMNVHVWERDSKRYKTMANTRRYKVRKYIERFIKINKRGGIPAERIKHLYLLGSQNIREPERTDWHHAVITFGMVTWKVDTT